MRRRIDPRWFLCMLLPPAVAQAAWPDTPLPPQSSVTDVAKHMIYNGVDMRAQVFRSKASQADVIAFYRDAWGKDVVVNDVGDARVIGHVTGDYMVTVQVSSFAGGSKGTIGVVDTTSSRPGYEPGKDLPKPMGSQVFNDISYPDDAVPARAVGLRNALSPRQNATFYRERLAADGWKPADANQCEEESCVMYYSRGDSKMTLVMSQAEGQSQVIVNVLQP